MGFRRRLRPAVNGAAPSCPAGCTLETTRPSSWSRRASTRWRLPGRFVVRIPGEVTVGDRVSR